MFSKFKLTAVFFGSKCSHESRDAVFVFLDSDNGTSENINENLTNKLL